MIQTLSKSEMLEMWRRHCGVEPLRLDATVTRTDGPDVDALLTQQMRTWYVELLATAPESLLRVTDVKAKTSVSFAAGDGMAVISVPQSVVRVLRVSFSDVSLPIEPTVEAATVRRCGLNPLWRRPLMAPLGNGCWVLCAVSGQLTSVEAIVDEGEEVYTFDERALYEHQLTGACAQLL
jgi:hypothetical protein